MTDAFIAEFYKKETDETPAYTTRLWHTEDGVSLIDRTGMEADPLSLPDSTDYVKVVSHHELDGVFSLEDNPELESIILKGQECRKTVLHAYEIEHEPVIACEFGVEGTIWASFTGNKPDSRVHISSMYNPEAASLPLRCFKEKMGYSQLMK